MKKTTFFFIFLISVSVFAQIPDELKPPSWKTTNKSSFNIKPYILPAIDLVKLKSEDEINDKNKSKPWRFGKDQFVNHDISDVGEWSTLPNGDRIWRMSYKSEGAYSLNFMFESFNIPIGSKLYVYSNDKKDLLRPFTHFNNNPEQVLGTWLVKGNHAWLEYHQPANIKGEFTLIISSVIHGYRTAKTYQKSLGDSGDCNQDVDCDITPPGANNYGVNTVKENVKTSAGMLVSGSNGFCSGALVNNTNNDGTPYFLTANHCGGGEGGWAFRFNWRSPSPSCSTTASSPNGSYNQTVSGAIVRMQSDESDTELVEITDTSFFNDNDDLVFAGWNRSKTNVPNVNFGIHHPSGDIQKVCREDDGAYRTSTSFNGNGNAKMWRIEEWELGVTEPGSSGSPLFNELGQIIGVLSGGSAACSGTSNNGGYDIYGRFGVAWDFGTSASSRLQDWLDPSGTNPDTIDQYPALQTYANDARVSIENSSSSEICGEDFTPSITIYNSGVETLISATITYNLDNETDTIYNWIGSLQQGESDVINIPSYTSISSGNHVFSILVSSPNGNVDENSSNDNYIFNFSVSPLFQTSSIELNILTDEYGYETTWELRDSNDTVIESGPTDTYENETSYQETISIPGLNECYTFTISDSYGDGICCGYGTGNYNLQDSNGNIIIDSSGEFSSSESVTFNAVSTLSNNDLNLEKLITVYPNPVISDLNIKLGTIEKMNYTILNLMGQVIDSGLLVGNTINKVNIESTASGIYLLRINSNNMIYTQKFIKE
tara:strand:- start:3418 stop:5736 length:2319 start_codon:yes stop_codon:yes gene_type:complete